MLNRWHDGKGYDNGGVCMDNLIPGNWCYYRPLYQEYVEDITKTHSGDPRILVWDICNEPFSYQEDCDFYQQYFEYELVWLTEIYHFFSS